MKVELEGHYGYKRIIASMLPMVAMMIVTSIYSIVDGIFVSNFAGNTAFAALNLVWPAVGLLSTLGIMVGSGGSALVSKTMGEGDQEKADRIFTMLIRVAFVAGAILTVLMEIYMRPIVLLLGAEGQMVEYAVKYGRIILAVMPLHIIQMAFNSFYMAAEKPQFGMQVSILCGAVNIVLDFVFIVVFGWGLIGAALGTAIAIAVGGSFPILWIINPKSSSRLRFRRTVVEWNHIFKACGNGLSEYVGTISLNIVSMAYNYQLMRYLGEDGVSAYGIIMYVGFIFGSVFLGYNMGISQVIAYNYGAGNKAELNSLLRKSLALLFVGGIVLTGTAELLSTPLSKMFVGYDPNLVQITTRAIRIYMLSFLLCGFNIFCSGWFTALNNGIISAIAAFGRTMVFEMLSVILLPKVLGIDGIWLSVSAAEIAAAIMTFSLIFAFRRRYGY